MNAKQRRTRNALMLEMHQMAPEGEKFATVEALAKQHNMTIQNVYLILRKERRQK